MTSNEIKILSNMSFVLQKIGIKDHYVEENYFNIYQLVDGYKKLEKYFKNKEIISNLLNTKINDNNLFDLLRLVRNRYSHIDKHNATKKLVLLQTSVDKNIIHSLLKEIETEMNNIYERDLNGDAYKFIMNSRIVANLFEIMNYSINDKKPLNEFDKKCGEKLKNIFNNFDYEESSIEDFEKMNNEIVDFYNSKMVKDGIINIYGIDVYNDLLKMMEDDSYSNKDFLEFLDKIKNMKK